MRQAGSNSNGRISAGFLEQSGAAVMNPNSWTPTGEEHSLKDLWDVQYPGLYARIEGNVATVDSILFPDGSIGKRLLIPITGMEKPYELNVGSKDVLVDGDKVAIDTIKGVQFAKEGRKPIVRFTGELIDEE